MGFFERALRGALRVSSNKEEILHVEFGTSFIPTIEAIRNSNKRYSGIDIDFPSELMRAVTESITSHQPSEFVLYDEEMQELELVGESFHQAEIRSAFAQHGERWLAGVLVPEPTNKFDPNAVMVGLIDPNDFSFIQVGHLSREQAKRVQKKIIKFLNMGQVIPVLLKMGKPEEDKEIIGVLARAKTSKINFEN